LSANNLIRSKFRSVCEKTTLLKQGLHRAQSFPAGRLQQFQRRRLGPLGKSQKSAGNNLTLRSLSERKWQCDLAARLSSKISKNMRFIDFFAGHITACFEMIPALGNQLT